MKLEKELQNKSVKAFFKVLSSLSSEKEISAFMRDVFTFSEIKGAARRLETAKMLQDKFTVREIVKATKMSSATISRINFWLHHGIGGYRLALGKLK